MFHSVCSGNRAYPCSLSARSTTFIERKEKIQNAVFTHFCSIKHIVVTSVTTMLLRSICNSSWQALGSNGFVLFSLSSNTEIALVSYRHCICIARITTVCGRQLEAKAEH